MRTLKIDFTSAKLLPEGNDAGYIGEHNATQLLIIPPVEMTECESVATYVVAFATSRGVLYSDSFLKSDEIIVSLTSKLTADYYLGVQLEGYDSEGELVVKSPLITQLQLSPSARGMGSEADSGSINGDVSAGSNHSHENKKVLDLIGQSGDSLTFNGGKIAGVTMGSKYYENNFNDALFAADNFSSPSVCIYINEEYPENRIITDISIRFEKDGTEHDYSFLEMITNFLVSGISCHCFSRKPMFDENQGMYAVANITNIGDISSSPFYADAKISDGAIKGLTIHYLEV